MPSAGSSTEAGGDEAGEPLLVVISGPSGAGKDSVLERLRERGIPAHFTVTATTRPQREVKSEDHRFLSFLSEEEFQSLLEEDGLLEHAEVYGYHYGVPKAPLRQALANGKDVLVRVDTQGAATIKKLLPDAVLIFLTPSSPTASPPAASLIDELETRLVARGQDDAATIKRRLDAARRELERQGEFDYVVVNERDDLDGTVDRVEEILATERSRAGRRPIRI